METARLSALSERSDDEVGSPTKEDCKDRTRTTDYSFLDWNDLKPSTARSGARTQSRRRGKQVVPDVKKVLNNFFGEIKKN